MQRLSHNLTCINLVILFYVVEAFCALNYAYFMIPNILIAIFYFGILSLVYRQNEFLIFATTSFTFLTLFFSFVIFKTLSWHTFWQTWLLHKSAIYLYTYLLLPCLFLSYTLNFFLLTVEIGSISRRGILRVLLPVIVKKELIVHRYKNMMESLWERGYDTTNAFKRLQLLHKWMIPLIVTTLMEGVESYEYNLMLKTNISLYTPSKKPYKYLFLQKLIMFVLIFLFIILSMLRYV